MSLSTILNEMEANRANADMDVNLGSPNTFGSRQGLKRAGTEAIKRLKTDYRNELMSSTVFIVVTGGSRDQFSELATGETFGCFSSDPEDFYKDLVSHIDPSLFGREGTRQLFNIVGNLLWDKCIDLDITSYNAVQFSEKYNLGVSNASELVPLVRTAVNDQLGSEIVGINAIHSIVDKAIEKRHTNPVTPLILNTSDEKFALDLYTNLKFHVDSKGERRGVTAKVFLVVAGKASRDLHRTNGALSVKVVSEESVGEALTAIRSKIS